MTIHTPIQAPVAVIEPPADDLLEFKHWIDQQAARIVQGTPCAANPLVEAIEHYRRLFERPAFGGLFHYLADHYHAAVTGWDKCTGREAELVLWLRAHQWRRPCNA